jgi:phosphocarrier protein
VAATSTVTVPNELGMHARAAARFAHLASRYEASVSVARGPRLVDGKSILGLLLLSAARGSRIVIAAEGPEAEAVVAALVALVERGFEEEVTRPLPPD